MSELREYLAEVAPEALVFDNPSFDTAIVGVSSDGAVVYSIDLMAEEFARTNDCSYEDAIDFIYYNTLRAIPFASGGVKPIVIENEFFDYKDKEF